MASSENLISMKQIILWSLFATILGTAFPVTGQDLPYSENRSLEYHEVIEQYTGLAEKDPRAMLVEIGDTDAGRPLHLFIISKERLFTPGEAVKSGKCIIMVNNGIHPGECNGIDASVEFAQQLLSGENKLSYTLENTIILIVPVFNVGGALNRSEFHRANQNGPVEHGFRGNARNLDLNRDFVKMDTRNARSLARTIRQWDPHILLDTHSTNGADYPYTVTLIASHHQQLEEPQASFLREKMLPEIFDVMNKTPYKTSHYVNIFRRSPEQGFEGFIGYPRYFTGFATAFHTLSFTVETHMLKPYPERVRSTRTLLEEVLKYSYQHASLICEIKEEAIQSTIERDSFVVHWYNDTTKYDLIEFEGYSAGIRKSPLTGQQQIYYDKNNPWTDFIPFYNYFNPYTTVKAPDYYIVPGAWKEVIDRLKVCGIEMSRLKSDTVLTVDADFIEDFQTTDRPYNGHYWHYATRTSTKTIEVDLLKGDYVIPARQRGAAYLANVLEPRAYDSYFSWNFFDATLMRQEYFSPYLFEETAMDLLEKDPGLKKEFLDKKQNEAAFSSNGYAQLRWIYERSPWSEPTYRRHPVFRFNGDL